VLTKKDWRNYARQLDELYDGDVDGPPRLHCAWQLMTDDSLVELDDELFERRPNYITAAVCLLDRHCEHPDTEALAAELKDRTFKSEEEFQEWATERYPEAASS